MRPFQLTKFELCLVYFSIGLFIISGAEVIKLHYQVVRNAYTISIIRSSLNRSSEKLEHLKVERSRIIVPDHLERVAGRGGYSHPRQEQIILLNTPEDDP